jgi:hypothetical protein
MTEVSTRYPEHDVIQQRTLELGFCVVTCRIGMVKGATCIVSKRPLPRIGYIAVVQGSLGNTVVRGKDPLTSDDSGCDLLTWGLGHAMQLSEPCRRKTGVGFE